MDFDAFRKSYPATRNLSDQEIAIMLIENNAHGLDLPSMKQKYGTQLPFQIPATKEVDVAADVVKSAAAGIPAFARNLTVSPQKAVVGLGYLSGIASPETLRSAVPFVQGQENWWNKNTAANFEPETGAGRFTKRVTESAIPIPGLGPVGLQTKLGAAAGGMSHVAGEIGFGGAGEVIASMLPYVAAAAKKSLTPTAGQKRLMQAWEEMTPAQRAVMMDRLAVAKKHDIPIDVWQAAPEGSSLYELGKIVATNESGRNIQRNIASQADVVGGKQSLRGQVPLSEAGNRLLDPFKTLPIAQEDLKRFYDAISDVATQRFARASGDTAELVSEQAGKFGRMETLPVDPASQIDDLIRRRDSLPTGSPERSNVSADLARWITTQGRGMPNPNAPEFVPASDVRNVGNVLDIRGELGQTRNKASLTPNEGTGKQMRGALNEVLYNKYPGIAPAMHEYGTLRDIIKSLSESQKLAGRNSGSGISNQASNEALQEIALGTARTPSFMLLPPVRRAVTESVGRSMDEALGQSSLKNLIEAATKNPKDIASRLWLASILEPAKIGALGWPEGMPEAFGGN